MSKIDQKYTVLELVEKINERHFDGILELLTDNFLFVDSSGQSNCGRDEMIRKIQKYLTMFPDVELSITHILQQETTIAVLGNVKGTYAVGGQMKKEDRWNIPIAWKAVIPDNKIAEIRFYADTTPIRNIIAKYH